MSKKIKETDPNYGTVYEDGSMDVLFKGMDGRPDNTQHCPLSKMNEFMGAYAGKQLLHQPLFLIFYKQVKGGE